MVDIGERPKVDDVIYSHLTSKLVNFEKMDVLQRRNVEVFDHEGAVVAGTSLSLISLY